MSVIFEDNSIKVKNALQSAMVGYLHEACGEIASQTAQNSKSKSGETKGSFKYKIDESKLVGYVGSDKENAVWEELGTGEYAVNKDGRKGGWWIKVGSGKNEIPLSVVKSYRWLKVKRDGAGNITYVFTKGKKPRRPMLKAFTAKKEFLKRLAERKLGELG